MPSPKTKAAAKPAPAKTKAKAKTSHPAIKAVTFEPAAAPPVEPAQVQRDGFAMIEHRLIRPSPLNPRKTFTDESLDELGDDIVAKGLGQNLQVRPLDDAGGTEVAYHSLIAGERRWRAIDRKIKAGALPDDFRVMVQFRDVDDLGHSELAWAENGQREDLAPLEEAEYFHMLTERFGLKPSDIAGRIHKSARMVQQRLQLLQLRATDADALAAGQINIEEARRRLASYPKPVEVTPAEAVAFLAVAMELAQLNESYFYHDVPCDHRWPEDPAAKALHDRQLLYFSQDYTTGAAKVCMGHGGKAAQLLRELTGESEHFKADPTLTALRVQREAVGLKEGDCCALWLVPPFTVDPERAEEIRQRDERNAEAERQREAGTAEQRAKAEAVKTKGEAFLADVLALQGEAAELDPPVFAERFRDLLTAYECGGAWAVVVRHDDPRDPVQLVDGEQRPNTSGSTAELEARRRVIAIGVNIAQGLPPFSGPPIDKANDRPLAATALSRAAFIGLMAETLIEAEGIGHAEAADACDAYIDGLLERGGIEYGHQMADWSRDGAIDCAAYLVNLREVERDEAEDAPSATEPSAGAAALGVGDSFSQQIRSLTEATEEA